MTIDTEEWLDELESSDLDDSPDIEKWESQLKEIMSETRTLEDPDDESLSDDLFSIQRDAEEMYQRLQDIMLDFPEKIEEMYDTVARIRAGRSLYRESASSGIPGPDEAWDIGEVEDEKWHADLDWPTDAD